MDIIRVLRVIEYEGPRDWVERTVANSIHGEKVVSHPDAGRDYLKVIRASTIGVVPSVVREIAEQPNEAEIQDALRLGKEFGA